MRMVVRFQIQDIHGRFWTGAEFSRDEDFAEEYRDQAEADEAAFECGGIVVEFKRWSRYGDLPHAPYHFSIAAE